VRGQRPEDISYTGAAVHLQEVWVALRAAMRDVLEHITLADVASNHLPEDVSRLLAEPGAWARRTSLGWLPALLRQTP
jgi:DNA-binding IscR family transcriptional regulator